MKRILPVLLALMLPAALFAQGFSRGDQTDLLKGFGLTSDQISQVQTIEKATHETIRADFTHIRLVQAQIAEALLPSASGPDAQAINALIDKKGQLRTDIEKSLMSAHLQLLKLMGDDNFAKYERFLMVRMHRRFDTRRPGMEGGPQSRFGDSMGPGAPLGFRFYGGSQGMMGGDNPGSE